ncbi:TonB-dependent receptor [Vibrio ponticus]|nr:TonB-dependent receptor [Vibrio ponticus]
MDHARHWSEDRLDVPASTQTIQIQGHKGDLLELEKQASNTKVEQSSVQTRVAIRGSSAFDTSLQQPVGYYLNDVALPLGGTQVPILFATEDLQLIKGPQGDLYGRHSEAGVVKINTLSPDWQPTANIEVWSGVTDGANDYQPSNIVVGRLSNEIIADVLAGSVAIRAEDTTGPQLNLVNDSKDGGAIENLASQFNFDIRTSADTSIHWTSYLSRVEAGKAKMRYLTGANKTDRFTTNYNTDTFDDIDSDIHSLKVETELDNLTVTSITGYTDFNREFLADLDLTPAPIPATVFAQQDQMLSQEIRLSTLPQQNMSWLVGLYLYQQESDINFDIGGSMMMPRTYRLTNIEQTGLAGFTQLDWSITNSWSLTLGLRAEHIEKKTKQQIVSSTSYQERLSQTKWLPKASLSYKVASNRNLYLTYSEGYLPGGFNYASAQSLNSFSYDAETSQNIEIGGKMRALNNKLYLDAALFYTKTKDKQINDLLPGFVQTISNAAQTSSYGLEVSARYQLTTDLDLFTNLGALNTNADEYLTNSFNGSAFVANDLAGNDLPLAPKFTYSLGVDYSPSKGWFANLHAAGRSKLYFDANNQLEHPASVTVDASVGYKFNHVTLALVADNVFDEVIYSRAVNTAAGIVVEDSQPRYIGLNLAANW